MISLRWWRLGRGHVLASIVLSALSGSSMMQALAQEPATVRGKGTAESGDLLALTGQLEDIRETLRRLEGLIAQVVEKQVRLDAAVASLNEQARLAAAVERARLDAAVAALNQQAQLTAAIGRTQLDISQAGSIARPATVAEGVGAAKGSNRDVAELWSSSLEIEVLGGVSGDELAAIVAWVRGVRAENRSSRIVVEPIMPLDSIDPEGQRRRLMDEAGRVIDYVFEELDQRVDIVTLVSEPVPGPRLRFTLTDA